MKKIYLLFLLSAFILTGCRTPEYYQDRAVQKARDFLLKNSPHLSYNESSYIRFNKPVILHSNIIGGTDSLEASTITSDMNQIQIVWNVPGQEKFYAVWGASSSTMQDYTPERIFVRKFYPEDTNRKNAVQRARTYIIGNLFSSLSVEDYNDLRFREPEVYYSKFELEKDLAPKKDEVQFAFVWNLKSKKDVRLAVVGNGRRNLADFKPVSGSELPAADVQANLLEPYKRLIEKAVKPDKKIETPAPEVKKEEKTEEKAAKKTEIEPVVKKELSETSTADSDVCKKTEIIDEKIVDELPEAPELDTENDLKEPDK